MEDRKKIGPILLIVIISLYTVFLASTFKNPAWESFNTWRQTDTYSIARNYLNRDLNLLRPQFFYDGPGPNIVQLELQILTYIGAFIQKKLGFEGIMIYRIISYLFFLGSGVYLYKIGKKYMLRPMAALSLAFYFLMPLSIEYSRAVMPESLGLFFYLGSLYYMYEWYDDGKTIKLVLSAIFMGLAISQKIPIAFAGLAILVLFFKKEGFKAIKNPYFYLYGFISLILPAIYFIYMGKVSTANFVSGIASKHIFSEKILSIFQKETIDFFKEALKLEIGVIPLVLALLGFIKAIYKRNTLLVWWTIAFILESITIIAIIKFNYYLVFILPLIAILAAYFLDSFKKIKPLMYILTFAVIVSMLPAAKDTKAEKLYYSEALGQIGQWIGEETEEKDIVAINILDPSILNIAERNGYRMGINYYDHIPKDPEGEISYYIENGTSFFYLIKTGDYEKFIGPLENKAKLYHEDESSLVYKIQN